MAQRKPKDQVSTDAPKQDQKIEGQVNAPNSEGGQPDSAADELGKELEDKRPEGEKEEGIPEEKKPKATLEVKEPKGAKPVVTPKPKEPEAKSASETKEEVDVEEISAVVLSTLKMYASEPELYVDQRGGAFSKDTNPKLVKGATLYKNPFYNK